MDFTTEERTLIDNVCRGGAGPPRLAVAAAALGCFAGVLYGLLGINDLWDSYHPGAMAFFPFVHGHVSPLRYARIRSAMLEIQNAVWMIALFLSLYSLHKLRATAYSTIRKLIKNQS